jgi:hypothetical protein
MKELTLRIKKIYLDQIISGEKKIEYRDNTEFYWQRIGQYLTKKSAMGKEPDSTAFKSVYFYCPIGATGKKIQATFQCKKIVGNLKTGQYEIHLGKKIK